MGENARYKRYICDKFVRLYNIRSFIPREVRELYKFNDTERFHRLCNVVFTCNSVTFPVRYGWSRVVRTNASVGVVRKLLARRFLSADFFHAETTPQRESFLGRICNSN